MEDRNYEENSRNADTHEKYTQAYVDLLNTYQEQMKNSVTNKNKLKNKFFGVIRFVMIVLMLLFVASIAASFVLFGSMIDKQFQSAEVITGAITAMISSFATMILSIFKLPKIIADYLFNKEEDQQMNKMMKNIQKYELDVVKLERDVLFAAEKDKAAGQKNDLSMESSPNTDGKQPESSETQDREAE